MVKTYYFAYGADMDMEELNFQQDRRRRLRMRFAKSVPAFLKGYRLVCDIESKHWLGGIFNVVPDPASRVYGVRYELHPGDTISIGAIKEGHAAEYGLSLLPVQTLSGEESPALFLHAKPAKKPLPPSAAYHHVVLKAAKAHRLPAEWIETLGGFLKP
jgi:hypothetical protein